ncbi:hypothetical protein F5887DRAFT_917467 [Amanita rubescens]|nr:hypothetical protein F5887DRAFT_917467 [Amanita rubescens]
MPDRNEEYYLEDIVFQVEDQLFKVHRRLFVKLSLVFHDMFIRAETDGLTEAQPLVLRGVEKKDFIPLLRCLYPMQFPVNPNFSLTLEEWQSVLKLASLYDMVDVKTLVIEKMEPLLINLPSLQIHLAKTYNIQKWLAPALYRLTQRAKPLDEEDARLVGLSDSLKICALREKLRRCEKYGAGIRSGGFGLKEIGHAFDIRDSDLLSSVLGCEQNWQIPLRKPVDGLEKLLSLWRDHCRFYALYFFGKGSSFHMPQCPVHQLSE